MMSELLTYLNEQLGVFLNMKLKLAENIKKRFLSKSFLYNAIFYQVLALIKFFKISYILL